MTLRTKIAKHLAFETFGDMASTSLLVCAITGVLLAVPYDVSHPYESISRIMIANPAASFLRNLHYWSAQFFLVLTVVHLFDHFIKGSEKGVVRYRWALLVLSLGVVFYAMISGFILKGDDDARQAYSILSSLLSGLPLIGGEVRQSLMGNEGDLQLVYIQHAATATVFLIAMTYHHAGRIYPGAFSFAIILFVLIILSFFLTAPLHDGYDSLVKGPWYFLGLQELLHWMRRPEWIWGLVLALIFLLWMIREVSRGTGHVLKWIFGGLTLLYLILTFIGAFFRGENWEWSPGASGAPFVAVSPVVRGNMPVISGSGSLANISGRAEGCMVCHGEMTGFSPSHDPQAIGCVSCHGGNPFTPLKGAAHRRMVAVPGNLSDARRSCGTAGCHPDIPHRVARSLMTTASGIVSVDRYVFGASDSLSALSHIRDIGHDAADQHLRDLCANCHLGMPKTGFGPVTAVSRGGGCNACHLNYSAQALAELEAYVASPDGFVHKSHPSLSLRVTDEHCFGCHSRSGRIALSYRGWHETLLDSANIPAGHHLLDDGRVVEQLGEDVHHKAGMMCIDCHLATALMGDGNLYRHKEEQVRIGCEDCHFTGEGSWVSLAELDPESGKIARLRYPDAQDRSFLMLGDGADYLLHACRNDTPGLYLERKSDNKRLVMNPPDEICTAGTSHDALSCESCHTAWVPQCIGCHNEFDPRQAGMDLLTMKEKQGSWVEYVSKFLHDRPVLGVHELPGEGAKEVITFTPGMILRIALDSYPGGNAGELVSFHRLYAPISAHTTSADGRDCVSCHLDPLALGYGRGTLAYHTAGGTGTWEFIPRFARNPNDGLPEDAWTGFLHERKDQSATRYRMRPFNLKEQQAILTVGACLTCHDPDPAWKKTALVDFEGLRKRLTEKCIQPLWPHR